MHDCLVAKNISGFWRTWSTIKLNSGSNYRFPASIDDISDHSEIANLFGGYFAENCTPAEGASTCNVRFAKANLLKRLMATNCGNSLAAHPAVSVDLVDEIVSDMKRGVAADFHSLSIEHIQHAQPSIVLLLVKLFNCIPHMGWYQRHLGKGFQYVFQKLVTYRRLCQRRIIEG